MENTENAFLNLLESEALEQLSELKNYRTHKGTDVEYAKRAKIALGVIGAYVRLRGTLANEDTNELVRLRLLGGSDSPKALPRGGSEHDA